MIPSHLFYQIYLSFLDQNDCTPPKCGELSEYTDSAHTEVENLSSGYTNGSNVYDRCGHYTRQLNSGYKPDLMAVGGNQWVGINCERLMTGDSHLTSN